MKLDATVANALAGGIGGTVSAIITCPLEVVKTRLQSSVCSFDLVSSTTPIQNSVSFFQLKRNNFCGVTLQPMHRHNVCSYISYIFRTEGYRGLFRGALPTLIGVIPSRGVYFGGYHWAQEFFSTFFERGSSLNFMSAACFGAFMSHTVTNPIWYIKTQLQLDQSVSSDCQKRLTLLRCIQQTLNERGLLGFYRGVQASYAGISETMIHFVVYEHIKARLLLSVHGEQNGANNGLRLSALQDLPYCSLAGACSKSLATFICYPHEVVRTRLRQPGNRYHGFWRTLKMVAREEGRAGLYRGLWIHYIRQIPTTIILMSCYELVLYLFHSGGWIHQNNPVTQTFSADAKDFAD